jgi:sugar/nucleoside kinase (ribokinase family)
MQMCARPMTGAGRPPGSPALVVVAGHICLDIIPASGSAVGAGGRPVPGALELAGPVALAIGGCVGNTGVALHRLGIPVRLVARLGDDPFGRILADLVAAAVPRAAARLITTPGGATSYSIVDSRPGVDRSILHYPGVNDRFTADDLVAADLDGAALLHVGYPPLMAALAADHGWELARLLRAARARGAITSLDMAAANLEATSGARWRELLRVLPDVDVFLPSLDEAAHLLGHEGPRHRDGRPELVAVAELGAELLGLGVAVAGLKLGEHGLYVRTAGAARMAALPGPVGPAWTGRELHSSVFESEVIGTTGAGDATIAGFLCGLVSGWSPESTMTAASAVGGASTEAADGTGGIVPWPRLAERLAAGWRRRTTPPAPGWRATADPGLTRGPRDP